MCKNIVNLLIEKGILMSNLYQVIIFSLVGGLFSLIAGVLLLSKERSTNLLASYATPFAAGALLSAAFLDLLPESSHGGDVERALLYTLIGILVFFLLERFLRVFHHHHDHGEEEKTDPTVSLIVIGDTIHNFIDGIAIAAGFLIDTQTGIVVTMAVAAHEIPQEVGDFGLLLKKGMSKANVLKVNILSALASTISAVIFYKLGESYSLPIDAILGLVAGMFIYIAVSDIIPSIHKNDEDKVAGIQTFLLILGVVMVGIVSTTLHQYIDQEEGHNHGEIEGAIDEHSDEDHDEHSDEDHEHK